MVYLLRENYYLFLPCVLYKIHTIPSSFFILYKLEVIGTHPELACGRGEYMQWPAAFQSKTTLVA